MANGRPPATDHRFDDEDHVSIESGESRFIVSSDEESEMTRYSVASKKQIKKFKKKAKRKQRKESNRNNNNNEVRDQPPPSYHPTQSINPTPPTIMKFNPIQEERRSNGYGYSPPKRKHNTRSRSSNNSKTVQSKRSDKLKEI